MSVERLRELKEKVVKAQSAKRAAERNFRRSASSAASTRLEVAEKHLAELMEIMRREGYVR